MIARVLISIFEVLVPCQMLSMLYKRCSNLVLMPRKYSEWRSTDASVGQRRNGEIKIILSYLLHIHVFKWLPQILKWIAW